MSLIITCPRNLEEETITEVRRLLSELGDDEPTIDMTEFCGIIIAETKVSSDSLTKYIKDKLSEEPWSIRYILRVIPIQKIVNTNEDEIVRECQQFRESIGDEDTYRISIKKRNTSISSKDIITKVAEKIKKKVSLENPTWVLLIEILGKKTGLSLVHSYDIISIEKLKRDTS